MKLDIPPPPLPPGSRFMFGFGSRSGGVFTRHRQGVSKELPPPPPSPNPRAFPVEKEVYS
jgi:hypothetical protein